MPIKVRPYLHQQAAFDFACRKFGLLPSDSRSRGVALLMEMGCGKTLTSIGIAGILYQFGLVNRVLVVAPLSILGVWDEEFSSMAAFPYSLTVLKGTGEKKRQQIREVSGDGLQVLVVNYESARILEKELLQYDADLIIADEGHKIKENRSKLAFILFQYVHQGRHVSCSDHANGLSAGLVEIVILPPFGEEILYIAGISRLSLPEPFIGMDGHSKIVRGALDGLQAPFVGTAIKDVNLFIPQGFQHKGGVLHSLGGQRRVSVIGIGMDGFRVSDKVNGCHRGLSSFRKPGADISGCPGKNPLPLPLTQ